MDINSLKIKNMLYQMFILGLDSTTLDENVNLQNALKKGLGGVIFFTKNIQSFEQIKKLTDDIKNCAKYPTFLAIDQEGGRVERSENIFGGKKYLSAKFAAQKGESFLKEQTKQISLDLKMMGMNLNFAPCIDVNTNPNNPIIGERAFSNNAEDVAKFGNIVVKTYLEEGIIPCTKHFPGHGDASVDSHLCLPVIEMSKEELEVNHISPFKKVLSPMVMVAHLHVKAFDEIKIPSSLSKNVVGYLKENLDYNPILITDDMVMGGVLGHNPVDACILAIKAGINILLYRDSDDSTIEIIEKIAELALEDEELAFNIRLSAEKIINFKSNFFV